MKSSSKGFTLSELLLAAAILAFALSGLLLLFVNCMLLNAANRNLTIATSHAEFALEEIETTTFASIASATWNNATITSKGLTPLNNESIVITVTGTDLKNISVLASWLDRGQKNRSTELLTLFSDY